ncbi:MAG: RDD family protein [Vicinamibacterales bacterium]
MKCPKCGYLGFEEAERCRNCGYDFALTVPARVPELRLRDAAATGLPADDQDLALIDAAAAAPVQPRGSAPATPPRVREHGRVDRAARPDDLRELPLFTDDAPLITKASPPRAPLAVRRATPDMPRLRPEVPRPPALEFPDAELEMPLDAPVSPAVRASRDEWTGGDAGAEAAGLGRRFLAAAIDLGLLAIIDVVVIYFTVKICGLTPAELRLLPTGPLVAFLLVQNGGYLVTFTAGGQTIGKMLTGIKVVAAEPDGTLDLGRSILRTFMWSLMALPAGLGLLTALLSPERRGFHDRFAGTKVVRRATA